MILKYEMAVDVHFKQKGGISAQSFRSQKVGENENTMTNIF